MKTKSVRYERLVKHSSEPFENERYGVEIELQDGDDPQEAMAAARAFVTRQFTPPMTVAEAQAHIDELTDAGISEDVVAKVAAELATQVRGGDHGGRRRFDISTMVAQRQLGPNDFEVRADEEPNNISQPRRD